MTIAGQTSPGGITVRGFHTTDEPYCDHDPVCIQTARTAGNWMLRYVRPEISRESSAAAGTVMEIELSNNLLWDPGYFIDVGWTVRVSAPRVSRDSAGSNAKPSKR